MKATKSHFARSNDAPRSYLPEWSLNPTSLIGYRLTDDGASAAHLALTLSASLVQEHLKKMFEEDRKSQASRNGIRLNVM